MIRINQTEMFSLAYLYKGSYNPYQLMQKMKNDLELSVSAGTMYPMIRRMERDGYVLKDKNGVLSITEKGKDKLDDYADTMNYTYDLFIKCFRK